MIRRRRRKSESGVAPDRCNLSPRRLEPRRLLDASAAGVFLAALDGSTDFVQAAADWPAATDDGAEQPLAGLSESSPPSNVVIAAIDPVFENEIAELLLTFDDADPYDTHTIEVDWGDGSLPEAFQLDEGSRLFGTTHRYLDDNPTATDVDVNTVQVRITDSAGLSTEASTTVTVTNVAPSGLQIETLAPVLENGIAELVMTFDDPGTLDSHSVEIDWGDGSEVETFQLSVGARFLATSHQYLDDNPTGTSVDVNTVSIRILDDDGGATMGSAPITVGNIAPSGVEIEPLDPIDENGFVDLQVRFDDPGTLDSHAVEIDWGDGSPLETVAVAAGARELAVSHQYLDDDPTGTAFDEYRVSVRVVDDDTGSAAAETIATVRNVAPMNVRLVQPVQAIFEGAPTQFGIFFDDPGAADTHSYVIDWGDGTSSIGVAEGRQFIVSHTYADNGVYTAVVEVLDDDLGLGSAAATIHVGNVKPTLAVASDRTIDEGALLVVEDIGSFTDPGFDNPLNVLDPSNGGEVAETFTYIVDWGDGTPVVIGAATVDSPGGPGSLTVGSFDASHVYADNGVYTVQVTLSDDDGGSTQRTFFVTVDNVAPTLSVTEDQTTAEGSLLAISDIATFTDPGFDNPLNTGSGRDVSRTFNGGEVEEIFNYEVDWGDGTAPSFGFAQIDVAGEAGVLTAGSFDAEHTYADNGVYAVTVYLTDDDGGLVSKTLQVTVDNVNPTLTGVAEPLVVLEGDEVTLAALAVGLEDPGFDNGLNVLDPANGGETMETFTATSVDWGDGTTADGLSVVGRVSGSPGVATTAGFEHAPHFYADNGVYTVAVEIADDDGGLVTRTFQIHVENVAPSLTLTDDFLEVDEGSTLSLPELGTFTDPGFDNPLNSSNAGNGGETVERFSYTIDWGDGVTDAGQLPSEFTTGAPEVPTAGSLANSHRYLDNDADNIYTITVTLSDDDGGVDVQTVEVFVRNINPTLDPLAATDVTQLGITTLDLQFSDPGADSFEILVDWGDKLDLPAADRFVVETVHAGPTPEAFTLQHFYDGPPDPDNPASDITITVKIHDDDFGTLEIVESGESNIEIVVIGQPGLGEQNPVFIDTTPQVPLLATRPRSVDASLLSASSGDESVSSDGEIRGSAGDTKAANERFLELRVIYSDGSESEGVRLKPEVLRDLRGVFAQLPDNHYAIYLVQTETESQRLVIEVYIRDGKLVDPNDDNEGARDRPPKSEPAVEVPEALQLELQDETQGDGDAEARSGAVETFVDDQPADQPGAPPAVGWTPAGSRHRSALAAAALGLAAASPASRIAGDSRRWRKVRLARYRRGRRPR